MSLTHVCVWDNKTGYRRISITEACNKYPYGVEAKSGLFVCELCAQNVLLTNPGENVRHFRHDPSSPNKECEERQQSFDPTYGRSVEGLNSHSLPIRIKALSDGFMLQMGFFSPPDASAHCERIRIFGDALKPFEYSFERIESTGTTFMDIGSVPSKKYRIEYVNSNSEFSKYYPTSFDGICEKGTFFDFKTGIILQSGAKAYSSNEYYLLAQQSYYSGNPDIDIREVACVKLDSHCYWHLYRVRVERFSKYSARFFLKNAVFLTEKPTEYYPIWPAYIREGYYYYYNSNELYFYLCGDDSVLKAFPKESSVIKAADGRIYKLRARGREQLVSFGKSGAMGFSYLIKKPLDKVHFLPRIIVKDLLGTELVGDVFQSLPKSRAIIVSSEYDGKVEIIKNTRIVRAYRITAQKDLMIEGLSLGICIRLFQGLDVVKSIRFENAEHNKMLHANDAEIVKKLRNCSGPLAAANHSFAAFAEKLNDLPLTRRWFIRALRKDALPVSAIKLIRTELLKK